MKNLSLSIVLSLLFLLPCATASAQKVANNEVSHWSLALKGGADYYRVYPFDGKRADRISWFPTLSLEYSLNPIWGFGLEGGFFNYGTHYKELDYQGHTIDAILYSSVNLANLFAPKRGKDWSGFNAYFDLGVGAGAYSNNYGTGYSDYKFTPAGTVGLSLEFALGKLWALDLGGQYRIYFADDMGGMAEREHTDGLAASIGLRYKFGAHKKPHVRNMTNDAFYPVPVPEAPVVVVDQVPDQRLMNRVSAAEDSIRAQRERIRMLEQRTNQINRDVQKVETVQNRPVQKDLILPNITFMMNQQGLSDANRATLEQIASTLMSNPNAWKSLEINGYTDSTGSEMTNLRLSEERAKLAANYLISKGISSSRISVVKGNGSIDPIASNNTVEGRNQNRRVQFTVVQ